MYVYESILLGLPAVGAAPPCHSGVLALPSTCTVVFLYSAPVKVTKWTTVIDSPVPILEFNVAPLESLKFTVQSPVAADV